MEVRARGSLRHYFWGEYQAGVALVFDSEAAATAALPKLGEGWKRGEKHLEALVWHGGRDALDALKARIGGGDDGVRERDGFKLAIEPCGWKHCRGQCADQPIDTCAHSIDFGANFTLTVECEDPRQTTMFQEG